MGRRKQDENLTKERTAEVMAKLKELKISTTAIAKACGVKYNAAYQWQKGNFTGPTALEGLLKQKEAEATIA